MATGDPRWGILRKDRTALAFVVAIHLIFAFATWMPAIHTGGDNAAYVSLAHSLAQNGSYQEVWSPGTPLHTKYPPVYPAALALLILSGAKTWGSLKAASVVFTGISTVFCFLWVRRIRNVRTATVVAALFGMAPAVLFASRWILSDPLFLALTLGCCWLLSPPKGVSPKGGPSGKSPDDPEAIRLPTAPQVAAGLALATLAYFTRSAGLPLIAAVLLWLLLQRQWVRLGIFTALFSVPAALWSLRPRASGNYVSEFWMINPYSPDLGRVGFPELVARAAENLWRYGSDFVPSGLTGLSGGWATALGAGLTGLTLAGWLRRVRSKPGVPEFFFLLYSGLILAWPGVWSGDRFALPLFPFILLYSGESLASLAGRLSRGPGGTRAAVAVAVAIVAIPAGASGMRSAGSANDCRIRTATSGPLGCYASNVYDFYAMARWAGDHLPEGSAVFSRKPRLFHVFSGLPSTTFPFSTDQRRFWDAVDSLDIAYVVVGNWGRQSQAYVGSVVTARPDRFCYVTGIGSSTSLLAITPPGADDPGESTDSLPVLKRCSGALASPPPSLSALASMRIPMLER